MIERAFTEALWYLGLGGALHVVFWLVLVLALVPLSLSRGHEWLDAVARRIALFMVTLWMSAVLASFVWGAVVWHVLYTAVDPVLPFQPFLPFGQWVLDLRWGATSGELTGATAIWQVKVLWWVFAVTTWATATAAYRGLRTKAA